MNGDQMRVSDHERERVAARLRAAMTEGRLNVDEFSQRTGAVYLASTRGELAALLADLPDANEVVPVRAAAVERRASSRVQRGIDVAENGLLAVMLLFAVSGWFFGAQVALAGSLACMVLMAGLLAVAPVTLPRRDCGGH